MKTISKIARTPRKISFFGRLINYLHLSPKKIDPIEKVVCIYHCIVFLGSHNWDSFSYIHDYRNNKFCMYHYHKLSVRVERRRRRLNEIE